jgi:hypothetical protein
VALVEEAQPALGASGELGVGRELGLEGAAERGVGVEHAAGLVLGDVGVHELFLLEGGVEVAPRRERVGRARLEQVHGEAGAGLADGHEERAGRQIAALRLPRAFDAGAGAPLEGAVERGRGGAEGRDLDAAPLAPDRRVANAV